MAIYDFKCNECGKNFSVKCSMHDYSSEQVCPDGHPNVSRIFCMPNVKIQSDKEAIARKYGGKKRENLMKETYANREKRKKDSNVSKRAHESNELWV